MSDVYNYPKYYEIAFSFRDIPAEVDLFEESFRRFARTPVRSVLEIACGNSPHMLELAKRGYSYHGLDLNPNMLEYSREKALNADIPANLMKQDMVDFSMSEPVEFAFIMLGSLLIKSTDELTSHFDAVARAVKPGGLYLLDWCVQYDPMLEAGEGVSWPMEADGIKVDTTNKWTAVDRVEQMFNETITLEVDDNGKKVTVSGTDLRRAIYPQEFLLFVNRLEDWEFVGWWNNWNLDDPLEHQTKIGRPVTILRRV